MCMPPILWFFNGYFLILLQVSFDDDVMEKTTQLGHKRHYSTNIRRRRGGRQDHHPCQSGFTDGMDMDPCENTRRLKQPPR